MKKVQRADLGGIQKTDAFSRTVEAVKTEGAKIVRTSYSLEKRHIDQINAAAIALSQSRGKSVGASEALRFILDRARETAQ